MWWWFAACKGVDPAPTELDDLLHFAWQHYDDEDDALLAEALVNLDRAVDGRTIEDAIDGTLTRLSEDEALRVGVRDRDPGDAAGVFMARAFTCDFGQLEEVLSYPYQGELYEGVYDAYARDFDTPRAGWLAGDHPRLDYDIEYTAGMLGAAYTARARGALRRVGEIDDESTPFGAFVVQRSFLPTPAEFEEGANKSLPQDYQLELYWARGPGDRVVHAYGMWRQADFGGGFDSEDEGTQRLLLNELVAWDDDTERLCAEGRP